MRSLHLETKRKHQDLRGSWYSLPWTDKYLMVGRDGLEPPTASV